MGSDTGGVRPHLLLLRPPFHLLDELVASRFSVLRPWESPLPRDQFLAAHAAGVRALLTTNMFPVDAPLIRALPALRLVVTSTAGLNHIDIDECARRGIAVANAGTVYTVDVAEYAVGLLIDVLRRISAADNYIRRGQWPLAGDYPVGYKLGGKRVGIVGLGSIGSQVAKRLDAFGCSISYFSKCQKSSAPYTYYPTVRDLATSSDALIVTCALNNETRHIVDREVMKALGKSGVIVNVGRGALIDEEELVRQLEQGGIGGAALDVFEREPIVSEKLFCVDNVVLSNHRAVDTMQSFFDVSHMVVANLEAFFAGAPLLTPALN